jgi:hypothetical protein
VVQAADAAAAADAQKHAATGLALLASAAAPSHVGAGAPMNDTKSGQVSQSVHRFALMCVVVSVLYCG